jgi:hypothetical protein
VLKIPESVIASFGTFLAERNIHITSHNYYKKWLRYYLDYCHKYRFNYLNHNGLPDFLNKLKVNGDGFIFLFERRKKPALSPSNLM